MRIVRLSKFGLMFKIPKSNEIYIIDLKEDKKEIIHTFFCLKPIDILLVNSKGEVVGFYRKVKPFSIIIPKRKFRYIIEGLYLSPVVSSLIRSGTTSSLFKFIKS